MHKSLILLLIVCGIALSPGLSRADELPPLQPSLILSAPPSLMDRAVDGVQSTVDQALEYLGIRYRRGGSSPQTGFDCSGFVQYVFNESLGLLLPRNAFGMSRAGEKVDKQELMPGDLVFFNTMKRTFSHVGIYLGNNLFVHAPRAGAKVRIEDMSDRYWSRRYNGARRVQP